MKKAIAMSAILCGALFGAKNMVLMPYASYVDYDDSTRNSMYIFGIYGAKGDGKRGIEWALDYAYIDYNKKAEMDYHRQFDATLMGSYEYSPTWVLKGGIHNIWSKKDRGSTNYDPVLKLGLMHYTYGKNVMEGDIYLSSYDDFDVYQLRLRYGEYFRVPEFAAKTFYFETALNQIHISDEGYAPDDNYTNIDLKLDIIEPKWSVGLFASLGKAAYKVGQEGWIVYNLGEEYQYILRGEYRYRLDKRTTLKVGLVHSEFDEMGYSGANSNALTFAYIKAF